MNGDYGSTNTPAGRTKAPAALAAGGISTAYNSLAMEPWTTCPAGTSTNKLYTSGPAGNRRTLCESANANTGTAAPQNNMLVAVSGSVNPTWGVSSCNRACLNSSATSAQILDSASNFGGNSMYRKFVYESFTTVYSSTQGYASCGNQGASSKIAWTTNNAITNPAVYQNYSSWMNTYAAGSSTDPCVDATQCPLNGDGSIPSDATASN